MKETKLKRLIKKMMDSIFLDAMTPEFKEANAELLKAIKMNDKSGAVPHADLEAVNKAMKENDADKAGAALKKVQLQFSKAEKKLDDDVKSIQAKLETTKKTAETAKASLKQKKALASVFDKLKTIVSGLSNNPKSASKLTALTDKIKDYGDLSKRASQIITLVSSNKDASKQIDMLKKFVDAAEKKYKKDLANIEKESKKVDDALEVAKMQAKITQGKRDAFTKERLYIANVVKQMPQGDLRQKEHKPQNSVESIINNGKTLYDGCAKVYKKWHDLYKYDTKEHKKAAKKVYEIEWPKAKSKLAAIVSSINSNSSANDWTKKHVSEIQSLFSSPLFERDALEKYRLLTRDYDDEIALTKDKKQKNALERIQSDIDKMGTIIYDYLNFKRDNHFEGSTLPNHPTNERIKFINTRINEEQKGYVKKIQDLLDEAGVKYGRFPRSFEEFKQLVTVSNSDKDTPKF